MPQTSLRIPRLAIAVLACAASGPSRAEAPKPASTPYTVAGDFAGESEGGTVARAYDISGAACRPPAPDGTRACLAVNDENSGAQFFGLAGTTITPGKSAFDQGRTPSVATRGTPPAAWGCSGGKGAFNQLDGEAVAYAEPYFYVAGSHGCTRGKRRYTLSAMVLTRLRPDAAGTAALETASTYRLTDALDAPGPVRDFLLHDLEFDRNAPPPAGTPEPNGLNVEGLAVIGDRLYAGLRAPSLDAKGYLISVAVEPLFASGDGALNADIATIPLALGPDAGIRDLAALPDGRLLVLSGGARNGLTVPAGLFIAELPSGKLTPLGALEPVRGRDSEGKTVAGKAEAIVRLGPGRVLVMFDGLLNGAPHEYAVAIP